jgi:hypothetical protein
MPSKGWHQTVTGPYFVTVTLLVSCAKFVCDNNNRYNYAWDQSLRRDKPRCGDRRMVYYTVYVIFAALSAATLRCTVSDGVFLAFSGLLGLRVIHSNMSNKPLIIVSLASLAAYFVIGTFLSYESLTGLESSGARVGGEYSQYIGDGKHTYEGKIRMLKFLAIGFAVYIVGEILRTLSVTPRRSTPILSVLDTFTGR